MENDTLLKAILIVSIVMVLIAIGWTWLEIMNYWQPPSGGVAAAGQRSARVASVSTPEDPARG
ncbi:MAG: hypothetical protein V5A84_02040 [Planctomycetota bacterium]